MKQFVARFSTFCLSVAVLMFLTGTNVLAGESSKANPGEIQQWHSKADQLPGSEITPLVWVALGITAVGVIAAIVVSNSSDDDTPKSVTPDSESNPKGENEKDNTQDATLYQVPNEGNPLLMPVEENHFKGYQRFPACTRASL